MLGAIDDMSLMIIKEDVKMLGEETKNLKVGILQLIRRQTPKKEEDNKRDKAVKTKFGKEIFKRDENESFKKMVFIKFYRSIFYVKGD